MDSETFGEEVIKSSSNRGGRGRSGGGKGGGGGKGSNRENDTPNGKGNGKGGGKGGGGKGGGGKGGDATPRGGQGGGGEQSGGIGEFQSKQQRLDNLINLITRTIEPEAWERRGGNWASLQVYRGALVIRAPRWIQRQINGFEYAIPTPKERTARTLRASGDQIRVEVPLSERMRKQYDQ